MGFWGRRWTVWMFLFRKKQRKCLLLKTDFGCLVSQMPWLRRPFRITIWCKASWTRSPRHSKICSHAVKTSTRQHFRPASSHSLSFHLKSSQCLWPPQSQSPWTSISNNSCVVIRCWVGSWWSWWSWSCCSTTCVFKLCMKFLHASPVLH